MEVEGGGKGRGARIEGGGVNVDRSLILIQLSAICPYHAQHFKY